MAAQPLRRAREPRGHRVPEGAQRRGPRASPWRGDGRRGVDGMAVGVATHLRRRPRLRPQVEHGLDARHPRVLREGARPPALPPQPAHLRAAVRLHRKLRAAPESRRGRARQGVVARQDVRRPPAPARQSASPVRVDVGPPRTQAAVHGRRDRPGARMVPRAQRRLAPS